MNDLLDSNYIDTEQVSSRPTGVKYGLMLGVAASVLGLISYLMGWMNPNSSMAWISSLLSFLVTVAVMVAAIRHHRDNELGGYISLGRCVMLCLWVGLVAGIITVIWSLLFFNLIAPDFLSTMKEQTMEVYEAQGMSEEQIEASMSIVGSMFSAPVMAVMGFIGSIFWGVIIGLIAGLIMKREQAIS